MIVKSTDKEQDTQKGYDHLRTRRSRRYRPAQLDRGLG